MIIQYHQTVITTRKIVNKNPDFRQDFFSDDCCVIRLQVTSASASVLAEPPLAVRLGALLAEHRCGLRIPHATHAGVSLLYEKPV
ncbi:MAG: hypothetical protein HZB10_01725 [Candidatus Yonathbacteria bacterium]|nr:hypothetical protein [Candidatus Yonathbacteria bacterium]